MGFFDFLYQDSSGNLTDYLITTESMKIRAKGLAINKAAGMIAKTISKAEFQYYKPPKPKKPAVLVKDEDYYLLNVRPNPNESGTTFWYRVVMKFLTDPDGALVIHEPSGLYLADTFQIGSSVNFPKSFSKVTIGELVYDKQFSMNDVLHLKLGDGEILKYLREYYEDIGNVLSIAANDYKIKNTKKWSLKIPTNIAVKNTDTGKDFTAKEYANIISKQLSDTEGDVVPIGMGIELSALGGDSTKTVQDFRDMLTVAINTAAFAYDIPQDLFNGNKTDKSTSVRDFATFAISQAIEIIEDEINAKWVKKENYIQGEKVKIDKTRIQHVDFFDMADAEIKLISAGYSHNDLRIAKGLEPVDEPWANERRLGISSEKGGENK